MALQSGSNTAHTKNVFQKIWPILLLFALILPVPYGGAIMNAISGAVPGAVGVLLSYMAVFLLSVAFTAAAAALVISAVLFLTSPVSNREQTIPSQSYTPSAGLNNARVSQELYGFQAQRGLKMIPRSTSLVNTASPIANNLNAPSPYSFFKPQPSSSEEADHPLDQYSFPVLWRDAGTPLASSP